MTLTSEQASKVGTLAAAGHVAQAVEILRGLGLPAAEIAAVLVRETWSQTDRPARDLVGALSLDSAAGGRRALLRWGADCVERVRPLYEADRPDDQVGACLLAVRAFTNTPAASFATKPPEGSVLISAIGEAYALSYDIPNTAARYVAHACFWLDSPSLTDIAAEEAVQALVESNAPQEDIDAEECWQQARLALYLLPFLVGAAL